MVKGVGMARLGMGHLKQITSKIGPTLNLKEKE